jgi:hypothetical protein
MTVLLIYPTRKRWIRMASKCCMYTRKFEYDCEGWLSRIVTHNQINDVNAIWKACVTADMAAILMLHQH